MSELGFSMALFCWIGCIGWEEWFLDDTNPRGIMILNEDVFCVRWRRPCITNYDFT